MDRQQHRRQYNLPYTPTDGADDFQQLGMKVLLDPREVVGNCQFEAAAHQMSLIGNCQTGVDLRRQAVNHIAENLLSYETFITGDPEQYLSQMSRSSTYGDHVTLQALSRIHNVQILIASARGAEYSVLVSPDGSYSHQRFLLTLGHYPEGMGEHYVSLDLDETRASVLWWATRSHHDDRGSGCDEGGGGGDEEDDGCDEDDGYDEVDDGRDEGGDGCDEGDGGCEEVDDGCDEGDGELGMGDVDYCMSEGHEFLPGEIQARIVHFALQSSPASRLTLQRVSRFFYDVVSRVPPPRLHISTTLLPRLPNPVSVRRLVQAAGRGSGLAIAIQRILATSQWYNAWLWLRPEEFDWYSVINVYYRNRNIH